MPVIYLETRIGAPPQRCFDLARDVSLHAGSMAHTGERAVAGVTASPMELGDTVTWEARHLGLTRRLTSRITAFDAPRSFVDEQARGPFAFFRHTHEFIPDGAGTLMTDAFEYAAPYGPLGALAERLFLTRYMRRLLLVRNAYLQQVAEAGDGERR